MSASAKVRHLAPPSELEATLAFEAEFGMPADVVREEFLEDLRVWFDRATRGLYESTAPFRVLMRDAGVTVREDPPERVFGRAVSVLRSAPTAQLATYERFRRRQKEQTS